MFSGFILWLLLLLTFSIVFANNIKQIILTISDKSAPDSEKLHLFKQLDESTLLDALKYSGQIYFFGESWIAPNYEKALNKYEKHYSMYQEDGDVLFMLGLMYSNGIGCPLNMPMGILFYNFASKLGNQYAMSALGYAYRYGVGVESNCANSKLYYYKAAKRSLKLLSAKDAISVRKPVRLSTKPVDTQADAMEYYEYSSKTGDASASLLLAQLYYFGTDTMEPDMGKAKHFFEQAALSGSDASYSFLGMMYYRGEGVPVDYDKAKEYFSYASERNIASAVNGLGLLYWHGHGVGKDLDTAEILFKRAADLHYPESNYNYALVLLEQPTLFTAEKIFQAFMAAYKAGYVFANTELVKRYLKSETSCSAAVHALRQVLDKGEMLNISREAYRFYVDGKVDQALSRYIFLAAQGFDFANYNAAFILEQSQDPIHVKRSLFFHTRAALLENVTSQKKIGDAFQHGTGGIIDPVAAVSFYYAASKGTRPSAEAIFNLGQAFEYGIGLKKDLLSAMDMYWASLKIEKASYLAVNISMMRCRVKHITSEFLKLLKNQKYPSNQKSKSAPSTLDSDKLRTLFWTLVLSCFIYWYINYYQNRPVIQARSIINIQQQEVIIEHPEDNEQTREDEGQVIH